MKNLLATTLLCLLMHCTLAQYYLRGVIHDERGNSLYNIKIQLCSKGPAPYFSGISGSFGIPISRPQDTITLQADGYETLKTIASAKQFNVFVLKMLPASANYTRNRLISLTKNKSQNERIVYYHGGESYSSLQENDFINAGKYPETGFALNIDKASYSNIRRFLNLDLPVPPDAVRIEEMLNYFPLTIDKKNISSNNFSCNSSFTTTPWHSGNALLFINIRAPRINMDAVPPTNLTFLIDVSGSMDEPNRLPLLKSAFKLLVNNLRPQDSVSIVVYGGNVGILLQPTSGAEKEFINSAIEQLSAGGETPGEAAIITAYALAQRTFNKNGNNRIILATDGDFNVGQTSDKELEDLVTLHKQSGIYLTCLGVGMGNYKDSKLETLAKKGNGNFAYIDNMHEAEKVMVTEFTKTLFAVADDAYASISFNPKMVKQYRLIGFDNKVEAISDTSSQLEGGEIGTGHSLIAVFEIEPAKDTQLNNEAAESIATVKLEYKTPLLKTDTKQEFTISNNFINIYNAEKNVRFAAAVIMFGQLLKQSKFVTNYNWDEVLDLAKNAYDVNDFSQYEFIQLAEKAKKIYSTLKKKKPEE